MLRVQLQCLLFFRRIEVRISARERHEHQLVLGQRRLQRLRVRMLLQHIRAQLYPRITHRGDLLNRLAVVSIPGNRRISYAQLPRAAMERRVKQ